jgi:hypothetical protein
MRKRILSVGENPKDSIENLFAESDYKEFNLNSENTSKTIISKHFYDRINSEDVNLSDETLTNFKSLFDNISSIFEER